jgi:hypothetical protein
MSDDAVDYSGTSDSDSESDKVPSTEAPSSGRSSRAESCILAHDLTERPSCRFRMRTFIAGMDVDRRL